jgi:hypothetical protein
MSGDGQREPAAAARLVAGGRERDKRGRNAGGRVRRTTAKTMLGIPRPDALIPALDEGQLAALREVGREWDRVPADRKCGGGRCRSTRPWASTLKATEVRPALFTRFVPVAGQDGQLPPDDPQLRVVRSAIPVV